MNTVAVPWCESLGLLRDERGVARLSGHPDVAVEAEDDQHAAKDVLFVEICPTPFASDPGGTHPIGHDLGRNLQ